MIRDDIIAALSERAMTVAEIAETCGRSAKNVRDCIKRMKGEVSVLAETMVPAGEGWTRAYVYTLQRVKEREIDHSTPDDPLVTEPVVKVSVPAPTQAEDIRAVLSRQPALVEAWR